MAINFVVYHSPDGIFFVDGADGARKEEKRVEEEGRRQTRMRLGFAVGHLRRRVGRTSCRSLGHAKASGDDGQHHSGRQPSHRDAAKVLFHPGPRRRLWRGIYAFRTEARTAAWY
jgi:hypothetical protein